MSLTGKQRRYLRGLAHALSPVVLVGHRGLSDRVLDQVETCLTTHELIKVKLAAECPIDRAEAATTLAERTGSDVAGTIGRIIILYRARPDAPRIQLPGHEHAEAPE